MEVEQPSLSSHNKDQTDDNDKSNWRRRLRLRKSSALSHAGKSLIEEKKVDKELTKETSQNQQKDNQVVNTVSRNLTFTCSDCKDGTRFSPDGLLKHFKNFHGGKGHPPSFSCDICNFVTPDFTTLQQHYLKHEHSKLTYELCNDKGLQTPSQITRHCKTHNSQYQCEKCKFSAKELTHFPHNSCPHTTLPALDSSQKSEVKPINSAVADAAGEPKKDAPLEHLTASCHRGWTRKNWWKNREVAPKQHKPTAPLTKFVIPKSEISWTSAKFLPFSAAGLLDENGKLLHPTRTLEETKQFLERTVDCGQKWPVTLKDEQGPLPSEPKMKRCATPLPVLNSGSQLCGLMEKNNISVPPDCTTKVVGFKMVDGKKHLVLKVIPSAKSEISLDPPKKPARLTQEELSDEKLDCHIARPSDQMCISKSDSITTADSPFNGYDSTSISRQLPKQGRYEGKEQNTSGDAPQVDNTEHDRSNAGGAFTLGPDAPAQLTLSGIRDVFDVASQTKNKNSASPKVTFNAKYTVDLNGETVNVPGEVGSVRKKDIPTLQTNMQEIIDTPKHTDNLDKTANDNKDMSSEPSTSQDDRICMEAISSCTSSDSVSMKGGMNSQLLTLMTEKDRSPDIHVKNMDKMAGSEATVIHSPLDDRTEQKMKEVLNSPPNKNGVAMLESNIIDPTVASFQKTTRDSLFISSSEHLSLFFQDGEDENMNNINPRNAHVCLDQTCTVETVEEPNLSQLSLQDSGHNPDLYQTLEKLPLTAMSHLLDDSEVAHRGITSQSEAGSMYAQQVSMHSSKAIPVTAVTNDKEPSQLPLRPESARRKRPREPTSKYSQGLVSNSKRCLVQNSQENDLSASIPYWEPPPPDIERTLRLFPFCSSQAIKVPRRYQPVVVLNHPDTDIPELANIMRSVHKHKEAVQRVVLSQGTLKALSELSCDTFRNKRAGGSQSFHYRRVWAKRTVKERFILNLKLKRLGGNKFKVADLSFNANHIQSSFTCWFCGRHFRNQEVWVGHGQRHIMEATRDWNKLFNNEMQGNGTDQQSFF